MASNRRQMMQPWPLCLMPFTQPKERSILPRHYTRVPSIAGSSTTSSSLVQDCASNTTLLTNVSPFNSQVALAGDNPDKHYYMENLKSQSGLQISKSQIYSDTLDPLRVKNQLADMREQKEFVPITVDRFEVSRPKINYASQVLAALSVSLGSMVVGFCCGYTSPALASMADNTTTNFIVTEQTASWIGSVLPLSALFGGIAGGPCIEYLGRRNTILATAFPFIAAGTLIAMATNVAMILIGRVLSGFSVGIASLSLPVYLGETLQPEVRGTLGLLPTAFGNIGILLCFIAGMYLNWSHLALLGALLPLPFLMLMFLVPETPRWYISKGKTKMARKSLVWLRGKGTDVTDELNAIEKTHVDSEKGDSQGAIFELFRGVYLRPLMICLGLMFFQQFSGINAVIFYTTNLFKETGSPIDEDLSTVIVGVVNFVSTFIATALIDRLGRKILLYISSIAMTINLWILGTYLYLKQMGYHTEPYGWIPLVSCIIYVTSFSLGFGPIPWLMMGEILPAKIRGSAASVATSLNWSCTFIVTKTFVDIMRLLGNYGTFWLFGTITFVSFIFTVMFVPETSGRSLEEIEKRLTGKVRRMSSVANMKPMPTAC